MASASVGHTFQMLSFALLLVLSKCYSNLEMSARACLVSFYTREYTSQPEFGRFYFIITYIRPISSRLSFLEVGCSSNVVSGALVWIMP